MPRPDLRARVARRRAELEAAERLRRLRVTTPLDGMQRWRDGAALTAFCDNDYLGLARHPKVVEAARRALDGAGFGGRSAHLIDGHHPLHDRLEEAFADWQQRPRALLFGSGYLANLGVLQALLDRGDVCVQDKLNHACLLDGARLSGAMLRRYPHADVDAAARQLQADPDAPALLATDGVFSMDGDLAPLPALVDLTAREQALLYVDDAHGGGVLGPQGRGTAAAAGLDPAAVPLQLFTLGKAFGSYGGVVVGAADLVDALVQRARSYLFTTALPPACAAAALAALDIVRSDEGEALRARLQQHIQQFRRGLAARGLPDSGSATAIQPILLGSDARTVAAAQALARLGVLVVAIRPPTVPEGACRLRITLSAAHTPVQIEHLLDALVAVLNSEAQHAAAMDSAEPCAKREGTVGKRTDGAEIHGTDADVD